MRYFFLITICFSAICQQSLFAQALDAFVEQKLPEANRSPGGIYYSMDTKVAGQQPKPGDYVVVRYVGKLLDGKIFDQSEKNEPLVFQLGRHQVISGWEEGLPFFTKGAKGKLAVPSAKAYGKRGVGSVVPPNADLIFEIELLDILDQKGYDNYMKEQEAKARAAFERQIADQYNRDKQLIAKYISENNLKAKQLPSGLGVLVKKKGKGNLLQDGDQVEVVFTGKLLDGSVFDSNVDGQPFEVVVGKGKTIEGWEEGLKHFKRGGSGLLMIPSKMAYGPRPIYDDDVSIPGNSVLIFEIKVLK